MRSIPERSGVDKAYGDIRYTWGTIPTDHRFTDQLQDSYIKLVKMGVRWYDPELGRWTSPDKIVPEPSNPQSLNRYSYAKNSPVRFVDPTGYFEEDQLKDWYGVDWKSLFDSIWQDILLNAEFGDVILYGNDLAAMFVQADGGGMAMWSMSKQDDYSGRGEISFLDSVANTDPIGLYRSPLANSEKGPSQGHMEHQYATDARFRTFARKMAWKSNAAASITLGYQWYRSASTNQHVQMAEAFSGFSVGWADLGNFSRDIGTYWLARKALVGAAKQGVKALAVELGGIVLGPATVALLGAEVYSWTTWDTSFALNQGIGLPPIMPAPSPE